MSKKVVIFLQVRFSWYIAKFISMFSVCWQTLLRSVFFSSTKKKSCLLFNRNAHIAIEHAPYFRKILMQYDKFQQNCVHGKTLPCRFSEVHVLWSGQVIKMYWVPFQEIVSYFQHERTKEARGISNQKWLHAIVCF